MSTGTHHVYRRDTGELTGQQLTMAPFDADKLREFTPEGCCTYCGDADPRAHRVVELTDDFGELVQLLEAWTPPPPPWAQRTVRLVKAQLLEQIDTHLAELDARMARPVGEIAEALGIGAEAPAAAVARLQAINAHKATIRLARGEAAAVADDAGADGVAALDGISWPSP